jgi:large subunit ribosomal protein L17
MAVIELVEELQVAATTAPAKKAARKAAAQQAKVEALAPEEETPATAPAAVADDQDAEPPVNASGDKGAEGPGDQAEGEDTEEKA